MSQFLRDEVVALKEYTEVLQGEINELNDWKHNHQQQLVQLHRQFNEMKINNYRLLYALGGEQVEPMLAAWQEAQKPQFNPPFNEIAGIGDNPLFKVESDNPEVKEFVEQELAHKFPSIASLDPPPEFDHKIPTNPPFNPTPLGRLRACGTLFLEKDEEVCHCCGGMKILGDGGLCNQCQGTGKIKLQTNAQITKEMLDQPTDEPPAWAYQPPEALEQAGVKVPSKPKVVDAKPRLMTDEIDSLTKKVKTLQDTNEQYVERWKSDCKKRDIFIKELDTLTNQNALLTKKLQEPDIYQRMWNELKKNVSQELVTCSAYDATALRYLLNGFENLERRYLPSQEKSPSPCKEDSPMKY